MFPHRGWKGTSRDVIIMMVSLALNRAHTHGGPSEAGDCSHPLPKMATVENPLSRRATFDNVIGSGSLRFLACEKVLDIANLSYNNGQSSRANTASRSTRIFRQEAGDSIERGGWLNHQAYLRGGWLWYLKYRVCLFELLYNTRMRYFIQHLASVKHIMIPCDVLIYIVRLEKEMGFVDLPVTWFMIIKESGPVFCHPFACRHPTIVMH